LKKMNKNYKKYENSRKHFKTYETNDRVHICTNKRCFNIVQTEKVMKIGTNEPREAKTLRIKDRKYMNMLLCMKGVSHSFDFCTV